MVAIREQGQRESDDITELLFEWKCVIDLTTKRLESNGSVAKEEFEKLKEDVEEVAGDDLDRPIGAILHTTEWRITEQIRPVE